MPAAIAVFALAVVPCPLATPQEEPAEPLVNAAPIDSAALTAELLELGDHVRNAQLEELAAIGDRAAYEGLVEVARALTERERIAAACLAFTGFGGTALEANAVDFLGRGALGWPTDPATRPCARALARFGTRATDELLEAARKSVDHGARSIAVGALAPVFLSRARDPERRKDDFALVLQEFRPPLSGTRAMGAELLAFLCDEPLRGELRTIVRKEDQPSSRRALAAATLVELGDPDSLAAARRGLRAKDPDVALALLEVLERRGVELDVDVLRRLGKAADPRVVYAAALHDCRRMGARGELRELAALARDREPERRAALARFLGERSPGDAGHLGDDLEAVYLELVTDRDLAVRIAALSGLSERRDPETVALLVERMGVESLRMRARIREVLIGLTAADHGPRHSRWASFWSDRGADFVVPGTDEVAAYRARREASQARGTTRARFFGLELASDRVAFVFDISGSMETSHPGGGDRLDAVKKELTSVLESFPPDGRFNLIGFNERARPMRRRSIESGPREVRGALHWVRSQRARGGTNVTPALHLALEDREIDTICVLTDGQIGSAGNEAFVAGIERLTQLREVRILGVSFGGPSPLLRDLAERTGGEYVER